MLRKIAIIGLACALSSLGVPSAEAAGPPTLYPASWDFGQKQVDTTTAPKEFGFYNQSDTNLVVSSVSISGTGAAHFQIASQECVGTLGPYGWCRILVSFSPTDEGDHLASLDVFTSDPGSPSQAPLLGKGVPPGLFVSRSTIDFGAVQTGTSSAVVGVYVSNGGQGAGPVTLGTATLTGPQAAQFSKVSDTCSGQTLLSGSFGCQIDVRMSPASPGQKLATLEIPSTAPTSPDRVSLTGSGFDASLYAWPSPVAFAQRMVGTTSDPVAVTVSSMNQGTELTTVGSLSITGTDASQFEIYGDTCSGQTLNSFSFCTFYLLFSPTSAGQKVATVQIPATSQGVSTTTRVSVSGSAVARVESLTFAPTRLRFGDVEVGSSEQDFVTLTNAGNTNVTITDVSVDGDQDFTAYDDECEGYPLYPGWSCSIAVEYLPMSMGPHAATLLISTSIGGPPYEIRMDGTGTDHSPPGTTIATAEFTPLVSTLSSVAGTTSDNVGVASVRMTFTHALGMSMTVTPDVTCSLGGRYCEWTALVPFMLPGPVTVNARGTDVNDNPELPGPSVTVLVV